MSTTYPRVYQYGLAAKLGWSLVSLLMIAGGLGTGFIWLRDFGLWLSAIVTAAGASLALFGVTCLISTLRSRLVLHEDRIAYTGVFATRTVAHADIVKTANAGMALGMTSVALVLTSGRRVTICDFGRMDDVLAKWLDSFPNHEHMRDVAAQEGLRAAIDTNLALGRTPDERYAAYDRHLRWARWLRWGVIALMAACVALPLPYPLGLYVPMAIPVVVAVVVALSQGRWSLTEDDHSGRVSLTGLLYLPVLAVAASGLLAANLIGWTAPLAVMAAAGVVLTGVVAVIERRLPSWSQALWAFVICALYAGGSALLLNRALDDAPPKIERVEVVATRVSDGTRPDYFVALKPWRAFGAAEYEVTKEVHDGVRPGDKACVTVYPGRFGWEYYSVELCGDDGTAG